jgi:hypothetical protein
MDINTTTLKALEKEFGSFIEPDAKKAREQGVEAHEAPTAPSAHPASRVIPPLHNRFEPVITLQHEKPEHRLIAVLKSTGLSNREIAEMVGYTPLQVSTVCKQEAVERLILERMHGTGDKAMQMLHDATIGAAERLIQIAETSENDETRRKANINILEAKYGKPNQPYSLAVKPAEALADSELAKIAQGN